MNTLLTTLFAFAVAAATAVAHAQGVPVAPTPAAGQQQQPAAPVKIESKVAQCIGCHNIPGYQASFPEVYKVPMIAGQSAKYIAAALNAYKTGDRKHPTMRGIADGLNEQDIAEISEWYAKLGGATRLADAPSRQPSPQVAALLQKAACASCHGANYSKPIDPSYPKIGGQHKDYLYVALKAYKTENNPAVGRNNGIMGGIAKQYSNAELKALSEYISSLDGDVRTISESRFRR